MLEDSTHSDSVPAGEPLMVQPITSILVGEAVYNLRAALDYLVYELSLLDSPKKDVRWTQFPIADNIDAWDKSCKSRIKYLSDRHISEIRKLQPAFGCTWTEVLRDFSNPDKHERLTYVGARTTISTTISGKRVDTRTGAVSE